VVRIKSEIGSTVSLSAAGSSDPDGNDLSYEWWYYREPSNYPHEVTIQNTTSVRARFTVPHNNKHTQHHIILRVTDNGTPNLSAYRRVIVQCPPVVGESRPSTPAKVSGSVSATVLSY
jgi:hypothetical protein